MADYEFSFVVQGFDIDDDHQLDLLYREFDEVTASQQGGRITIEFVVASDGMWAALESTWHRLEAAVPGTQVVRLDRDLVTMPDIAARTGRSPESVRLLVTGKRGDGDFPAPFAVLGGGTRVWEWASVVEWFQRRDECLDENSLVDPECAALFDAAVLGRTKPSFVQTMGVGVVQGSVRRRGMILFVDPSHKLNQTYDLHEASVYRPSTFGPWTHLVEEHRHA